MAKKYVVAALLGAAFLLALFSVISFNKKNESIRYDKEYIWHAESDAATGTDTIVRGRNVDHIRKDVNKLVLAINKATEEMEEGHPLEEGVKTEFPMITLEKIDRGTADVEIANDQYLSENMGSSGAQDYLAEVTYTLTENRAIKAVNFIFNAGDHAMPGLYSRESFTNYKISEQKKKS